MNIFQIVLICVCLFSSELSAHKPSDSYLNLRTTGVQIDGQWDVALRDLEYAMGLDQNGDGNIVWGEVQAQHENINRYLFDRLILGNQHGLCKITPLQQLIDHHTDGAYVVVRFSVDCLAKTTEIDLDYRLFFDLDPQHKGLLKFESTEGVETRIFSENTHLQTIHLYQASTWLTFLNYIEEGVWHILIGYDHLLFLLSLLLASVLRQQNRLWVGVLSFKEALADTVKIVTGFTLAHSITLSMVVFGVIVIPSRVVESLIALSVIFAAINNLYPWITNRRWLMAFSFGLIHGMGFANVLQDLGLHNQTQLLSLLGFNLGVETGQLSIVMIFLPLAFSIRNSQIYTKGVMGVGSLVILVLACMWFTERVADVKLF